MEETRVIEDFPEYGVSRSGEVYTLATGRKRLLSRTRAGAVKITLFKDGVAYTRSLPRIVADAWLYNDHDPEIFDTPIHLDNDLTNNHVDNLAWRPRWFAVKYQQQYWRPEYRHAKTQIEDRQTGEIYDSYVSLCQRYGFLYIDVIKSCMKGDPVFPSWREFSYVE